MRANFSNFRFPLVMAWRETRAATGKFVFVVLSVALGAAALTAVTGFNESVRYTLLREARSLMAGDISLRMPIEPSRKELEFLDRLRTELLPRLDADLRINSQRELAVA